MFPATLFDFNGVLVDDEHVHLDAFRDVMRPLGLEISEAQYWEDLLGYDDVGVFSILLKNAGLPCERGDVMKLVNEKRPHYMRRAKKSLKTFPGAAKLIQHRAASGPVGIVSGALGDEIEFGLEILGVSGLVPKIISAEETTRSKPDPQGYLLGVAWLRELIGERAERALVIEDSIDGVASAKAAGLPCLAVAHSYKESELKTTGADLVLPCLEDISGAHLTALYEKIYG